MAGRKPRIAVLLGDPAGIGPELVARLLAEPGVRDAADLLLIADRGELDEGMRIAGLRTPYTMAGSTPQPGVPVLLDFRGATLSLILI